MRPAVDGGRVSTDRVERVAEVLREHGEMYDRDCDMYFGCACGLDDDRDMTSEEYVRHVAALVVAALGDLS